MASMRKDGGATRRKYKVTVEYLGTRLPLLSREPETSLKNRRGKLCMNGDVVAPETELWDTQTNKSRIDTEVVS